MKRLPARTVFTTIPFLLFASFFFFGCTRSGDTLDGSHKSVRASNAALEQIKIDTVKTLPVISALTLSGKIQPDESRLIKIFPLVSGVAGKVGVEQGDHVAKGTVLATLKSAEMAGFEKDRITSESELKISGRSLDLAKELYKSGLSSQKELELAKSDYEKAKAELRRTKAIRGINRGSNQLGYELRTPISGFVVEKNISSGMQVRADNGQNLFTVADLSSVWVMINVYESDIPWIKVGDEVKISTLSYPDKIFRGKIDKVYDFLDQETRVMRARVSIRNTDTILKPGMFANITIGLKSELQLPCIPLDCLVFDDNKNYVVVIGKHKKPSIREVTLSKKIDNKVFISYGLAAGDLIAASRQVYLYQSLKK